MSMLLTLYCSVLLVAQYTAQGFSFRSPADCTDEEFFDTASLICRTCSPGQTLSDGECVCSNSTILKLYTDRAVSSESSCSARCDSSQNEVASETGAYCVYCDPTTGIETKEYANGTTEVEELWTPSYITSDGRCECVVNSDEHISTEFDATGAPLRDGNRMVRRCLHCPTGTAIVDGSCGSCAFPLYFNNTTRQCECIEDLNTPVDCFGSTTDETFLLETLGLNIIDDENAEYIGTIGRRCLAEEHIESCNALANECVLEHYQSETLACKLYNAILNEKYNPSDSATTMDQYSMPWARSIPWIFYTDTSSLWKQRTDLNLKSVLFILTIRRKLFARISKEYAKDDSSALDHLHLILSSYSRNGTWHEFVEVTNELQLCKGTMPESTSWKIPTRDFVNSCTLDETDIEFVLQVHENTLYELFLLDTNGSLYPIPVQQTRQQVSDFTLADDEPLVRRFFLAQKPSSGGALWHYAKTIQLDLYLTPSGDLKPPTIQIEYDELNVEQFSLSFKLSYRTDPPVSSLFRSHSRTALVASIVATLFIGLALILREARGRQPHASTLNFLCFAIACLSNVLSITLTVTLIYTTVFFWLFGVHFRSDFKILAADSDEFEHSVVSLAIGALVSQILSISYSLYQQVTYELYFVDWENPRRIVDFESGEETNAPVSCWRRLLVANEWNELETKRRYPTHTTIVFVILLLEGMSFWTGTGMDLYREEGRLIRLGRVLALYLLVLSIQITSKWIESTCVKQNPVGQFVDLLFVANISCLILDTPCSGYYLHGRNQNLHSDVSLNELNEFLVQEQHGLLAQRGLLSLSNQDQQVFKCFIPVTVYQSLQDPSIGINVDHEKGGHAFPHSTRTSPRKLNIQGDESSPEEQIQKMIREIENNISEQVVYQSLFHQLFASRPDVSSKRSLLTADDFHSFQKLTLQGIEAQLCLLEMLLVVVLDFWLRSIIMSSVIVVILAKTLETTRSYLGQINISRETKISRNFLI